MIQRPIRGVVHGRVIELNEEPGCPDGQIVEVELRNVDNSQAQSIQRDQSGRELSEEEWNAWETTMTEIVSLRKHD